MTPLRTRANRALAATGLALVACAVAAAAEPAKGCDALPWPLQREVQLFSGTTAASHAGIVESTAPSVAVDTLAALTLSPQSAVTFAHPPEKVRGQGTVHAGLVRFTPPAPGDYRVTLGAPAWIDAVQSGALVRATRFVGMLSCGGIHKSVEFRFATTSPVTLQISGAPAAALRLTVTRVAPAR